MVEPCIELHTVCAAGDVAGISDVGYMASVLSARIMKWPLGTGAFFLPPQLLCSHRTIRPACTAWYGRAHMGVAERAYLRRSPFGLLWHNG